MAIASVPVHAGVAVTAAAMMPVFLGLVPPKYALYVAAAAGCAAAVAAILPPAQPDPKTFLAQAYAGARAVIDLMAQNYGSSKNERPTA